ncbi:MAG TPA: ABC transporter permease [Firmicutes bacterium]|jgi:raffinose/stachyose/melibiose transport system permease protein|nr:ABC transporter permease [Bacillota bacterium]
MNRLGKKAFEKIEFGIYVLPIIIFILFAFYIPFGMNIFYSMTHWNGIQSNPAFVGLKNYQQILHGDIDFANSAIFTIKYGILYIIIINVLALLLAMLLVKKLKTKDILRAGFFIPYILSLVIVGFVWKFIFAMGFDSLSQMTGLGIFKLSWLGVPNLAFLSVLLVSVWQSVGFYSVIYIAGLQSIPQDIMEAAVVDGVGPVRKFFSMTLPMLMPSVTTCVFLALTNSVKVFDVILSLTGGGPGGTTASVTYNIYQEAFQYNNYGYGTAESMILFIVVMVVTLLQVSVFKSKEVEA